MTAMTNTNPPTSAGYIGTNDSFAWGEEEKKEEKEEEKEEEEEEKKKKELQ